MNLRETTQDVYSMDSYESIKSLDNSSESKDEGQKSELTDAEIITRTTKWRDSANTLTKEIKEL